MMLLLTTPSQKSSRWTPKSQFLTIVLTLFSLLLPSAIHGHGYLKTPRSRNYVAYQDGVWWPISAENPEPESEPQSANIGGTLAQCGIIAGLRNYDFPKNALGNPMPPRPQQCYQPGQTIDLQVTLTAHHKGHFEYKACPISPGQAPTQACFDAHPLKFISDVLSPGKHVSLPSSIPIIPNVLTSPLMIRICTTGSNFLTG